MRMLPILLAAVVALAPGKAFTASKWRPAGLASAAASGYEVRDLRYALVRQDPARVEAVSFTLAPTSARRVHVRFGSSAGLWYPCEVETGRATCKTTSPPLDLEAIDSFAVAATS